MQRNPDLMFEFACHEGNYGMHGIMASSRVQEQEAVANAGLHAPWRGLARRRPDEGGVEWDLESWRA